MVKLRRKKLDREISFRVDSDPVRSAVKICFDLDVRKTFQLFQKYFSVDPKNNKYFLMIFFGNFRKSLQWKIFTEKSKFFVLKISIFHCFFSPYFGKLQFFSEKFQNFNIHFSKVQYVREQMGIRANGNLVPKIIASYSRANGNSRKWEYFQINQAE